MTEVVITVTYAGEPQESIHPFVVDASNVTFKDLKKKVSAYDEISLKAYCVLLLGSWYDKLFNVDRWKSCWELLTIVSPTLMKKVRLFP